LLDQLKAGGRMVLPIGDENGQQLTVIEKTEDGTFTSIAVMPVTFTQLETTP
jgi:protein-L-isoaspartate(D-aspartate) O-methyltransferase